MVRETIGECKIWPTVRHFACITKDRGLHPHASCDAVKRKSIFVICASAACLTATVWWFSPEPTEIYPAEHIAVDGVTRTYRLVIPRRLAAGKVPAVFAFHGIGDSPAGMAAYSQLDRLAAQHQFILAYPAARKYMWDTTHTALEDLDVNPDIRFFDRLLDDLSDRYPIDLDRVYVVGMSNGATFVQVLAFVRSKQIAAVAAHSGPKPKELQRARRAFPVLLVAGEEDFAVHAMRSDWRHYRRNRHAAELIAVKGLGHAWSKPHNVAIWTFLSNHHLTTILTQ